MQVYPRPSGQRCKALLRGGVLLLGMALTFPTVQARATDAPELTAWALCQWGSLDCNVCVPDAADAIGKLRSHGDAMGFHMNGAPDPTLFNHWEGVQRLMSGEGQYFAVSRALGDEDEDVAFVIVEMASRNNQGLRFRSNRLDPARFIGATPPPADDRIVAVMPHEVGFTHAGGMQALGSVLAVPFERATQFVPIIIDGQSQVVFYDLADPLHPIRLSNIVDHTLLSTEAGTASLGTLADGRFLLVIGRAAANILDFYVSTGTDLRTTGFEFFDTWSERVFKKVALG